MIDRMQPYIEINAHFIGKSHYENGLVCEDYSAEYADELLSVVAISDGHGDKNCFRSAAGAQYACNIGIDLCRQFQAMTAGEETKDRARLEEMVAELESQIADRWKETVLYDASEHPFTEEELSQATEQAREAYTAGSRLEKAYGCTLIIALCCADFWVGIQIGDGKCVAAYNDGIFVEPIPADDVNCVGNRSASLCNSNAKELFRHYISDIMPTAVFVSSDGIEESFDSAGLYNCFYSVAYWLKEEGRDSAFTRLNSLLPQISEGGSGDDVSLSAIVSQHDQLLQPRQTLGQVYDRVNICQNALDRYSAGLDNANDRIKECDDKKSSLEKDIEDLKARIEEKTRLIDETDAEREKIQTEADELKEKVQKAAEQMEKAAKYRVSAEKYWLPKLEQLGIKMNEEQAVTE